MATNHVTPQGGANSGLPLALHIRRHRKSRHHGELTQAELASLAGLSRSVLSKLERTRRLPALLIALIDIAIALDVSLDELIAPAIIARRADRVLDRHAKRMRPTI